MKNKYKNLADEEINNLLNSTPRNKWAENQDLLIEGILRFIKLSKLNKTEKKEEKTE